MKIMAIRLNHQTANLTLREQLTVGPEESREKALALLAEGNVDAITFTSSSTVRNLLKLLDGDVPLLKGPAIAYIGPVQQPRPVETRVQRWTLMPQRTPYLAWWVR